MRTRKIKEMGHREEAWQHGDSTFFFWWLSTRVWGLVDPGILLLLLLETRAPEHGAPT